MMFLRQATSVDVPIGPFLDETDGKTAETALTITQPDIRLKKGAGNWAQKNAAQTLTHEEAGWYELTLDATDTDTVGSLIVAIHESGALPVWREFWVLEEAIYDSLFAASAAGFDATGRVTVGAVATGAITAAAIAADAIGASELAADAVNEIADGVLARTLAAESYAADGAVPTLSQILYMLWSAIADFAISGTTITCRKLDGSTTSMTFTLDNASAPTSRTRAT